MVDPHFPPYFIGKSKYVGGHDINLTDLQEMTAAQSLAVTGRWKHSHWAHSDELSFYMYVKGGQLMINEFWRITVCFLKS
jgi:hypothetical protein